MFFIALTLSTPRLSSHNIGQRRIFKDPRSCITNIEKYLIKRPMLGIAIDQFTQLLGVPKRR